jgi:hypothetical protein
MQFLDVKTDYALRRDSNGASDSPTNPTGAAKRVSPDKFLTLATPN